MLPGILPAGMIEVTLFVEALITETELSIVFGVYTFGPVDFALAIKAIMIRNIIIKSIQTTRKMIRLSEIAIRDTPFSIDEVVHTRSKPPS